MHNPTRGAPAASTPPTKRALVVDDNRLNARLVALFLKRLDWQVETIDSGDAALSMLGRCKFDLVLLDLRMPRMSGERVCDEIRQGLGLTTLRVIAYTAHSTPEERQRILASGFNGVLIKPISFADVQEICSDG